MAEVLIGYRTANSELAKSQLPTVAETYDLQRLNILTYLSAAIAIAAVNQPLTPHQQAQPNC